MNAALGATCRQGSGG